MIGSATYRIAPEDTDKVCQSSCIHGSWDGSSIPDADYPEVAMPFTNCFMSHCSFSFSIIKLVAVHLLYIS